jgi:SAM-dependent MidA family methyltransferase
MVENSAVLRRAQAARVPHARWHDDAASLPDDAPLLVVANEFFDALPVRQLVRTAGSWRELMVAHGESGFTRVPGNPVPLDRQADEGAIIETSPASISVVRELASRLVKQGGAALIVDYGHVRSGFGDTLQAVSAHAFADPWKDPGSGDLTAHVDFEALGGAALAEGVRVAGPVEQGAWLSALGIQARAAALAEATPERAEEIESARERLVSPHEMGKLFKVMALVGSGWPDPEGFL